LPSSENGSCNRFRQQYPAWAKDAKIGYNTINARAEEAASKPAFREAFKKRRCLVPADYFYEWKRLDVKSKRPFAIGLKTGKPHAFAGLWESWRPKDGETLETFTILTTDPNEILEPIHNRMPVILEPKDYDRWLDAGDPAKPPVDLLRPYPAEKMLAWPISDRVGNVRNNDPALLETRAVAQSSLGVYPNRLGYRRTTEGMSSTWREYDEGKD